MKKSIKITALTCLTAISLHSFAKSQSGIYLTASDYSNKKTACETNCRVHPNNTIFNLPYITVIDNNKREQFKKSDIFGYVDGSNKVFRFYHNEAYQIAEAGNVIIYVQHERNSQTKEYKVIDHYYFSTSTGSEIMPLTLYNLKNAYRTNNKFPDLLDQFFNKGDVTAYDSVHSTFRINYIFSKAKKE